MKKGKINLLSFEDEEEEELNIKPSIVKKEPEITRKPPLDLSQIKDRVIQMELDEEMVIEGEIAEALFEEDNTEDSELLERIKEAKKKRREANKSNFTDISEELPDYIPITTKGDYWLTQDTKESEEAFNKNSSRLVREDLFNEIEVDDASGAYTSFIGKSEGRQGLMMTKKMLERDIKTEDYDLELVIEDEEWERSQVLKGIEKGWNRVDDEVNFYSKQAKLPNFIPPPPIDKDLDVNMSLKLVETREIELNIEKISEDSRRLEERVKELESEIENRRKIIEKSSEIETFFMRYSRFLAEKLAELDEMPKDRVKWEHFFDNVDIEDSDLLDLPDITNKLTILGMAGDISVLKETTELFVKYHFMAMEFDSKDAKMIWESSGLADAMKSIEKPLELIKKIYSNEPEKFKLIEESFKE